MTGRGHGPYIPLHPDDPYYQEGGEPAPAPVPAPLSLPEPFSYPVPHDEEEDPEEAPTESDEDPEEDPEEEEADEFPPLRTRTMRTWRVTLYPRSLIHLRHHPDTYPSLGSQTPQPLTRRDLSPSMR